MTNRRRNQAQLTHERRRLSSALQVVPRTVASAAEQSVSSIKPNLLRYIDLPPALALLVGAMIIALVCFIYLTQVTAVTNANYTLQALQDEHTKLLRQQGDLQLQIGRAQSLSSIEISATAKLHMVPIGNSYQYLPVATGPLTSMPPLPTPALPGDNAGDATP